MCPEGRCEHHSDPAAAGRQEPNAGGLDRRRLLMAAATGAAAITLAPVTFAQGQASAATAKDSLPTADVTRVVTGHLETGVSDFVYLPVKVPKCVQKIAVEYSYDKPA